MHIYEHIYEFIIYEIPWAHEQWQAIVKEQKST